MEPKNLCGIDEAGRGPLAGSLVMAGVVLTKHVAGLTDSKKLSEKKRLMLYEKIIESGSYSIVSFSAGEIDEFGISHCLQQGLHAIQEHLPGCHYLFDGNSTFGVQNIETLVKADDKIAEVSAASILAKVTRDREMACMAEKYPEYGFEKHKGYGTKAHIEAIVKYDRCAVHRKSFRLKGVDEPRLF